ncbi:MAG: PfaD family polyunsaturated fatty acid/polyketide biosynthesis protein [Desulfobacterales bacterium]
MQAATPDVFRSLGRWMPTSDESPQEGRYALEAALLQVAAPLFIIRQQGQFAVTSSGKAIVATRDTDDADNPGQSWPLVAWAPPLLPETLGSAHFRRSFGLRYAYVMGAMANGIASVEMVAAAGKAGMIGFFGAAGLTPDRIETAIDRLQALLPDGPLGFNLIHSPHEPDLEAATVDLYLRRGIRNISAAAYLRITLPLIRYRLHGIHRDPHGRIICPNRVVAKVSRVEVARQFFAPPPEKILARLVQNGAISEAEAVLARSVPVASDLTAEADSGGHTDNRQALTLLPTMMNLRDEIAARFNYAEPISVGLGGGIATPEAAAAAFALGADYILTGTVNQACIEAGTSEQVRQMLAEAQQADVTMAPAADMFEMGVKVQVLKRGTMFALRARKLYEYFRQYASWEQIPAADRELLERDYFRCAFEEEWRQTRDFFAERDPRQITKAEKDPRHKMALVFRAYLGKSSKWANSGEASRQMDFQIWCGPAIGAFNQWTRGSFLEKPANRECVSVALNLLLGAAVIARARMLRQQGAALPAGIEKFTPLPVHKIQTYIQTSG